jgi:hypothetical protein
MSRGGSKDGKVDSLQAEVKAKEIAGQSIGKDVHTVDRDITDLETTDNAEAEETTRSSFIRDNASNYTRNAYTAATSARSVKPKEECSHREDHVQEEAPATYQIPLRSYTPSPFEPSAHLTTRPGITANSGRPRFRVIEHIYQTPTSTRTVQLLSRVRGRGQSRVKPVGIRHIVLGKKNLDENFSSQESSDADEDSDGSGSDSEDEEDYMEIPEEAYMGQLERQEGGLEERM